MPAETIKRIGIILMLGLLTASAFFIRLENFKNSKTQSIDEVVYYRMAKQILNEGLSGYNTVPYGRELAATGRPLPKYFFEPLFKHPPLFTFLIALSMKIFGVNGTSAVYVSLLFGVLLIPLTYLIGCLVSNPKVGLISAILMWLDPMSIICSQKVWMETTVAFFVATSLYTFARGLRTKDEHWYITSGVLSGLGVLTKYTGGMATAVILCYAIFYKRTLVRNSKFIIGLFLPFLFLLPWFAWNIAVYGLKFFSTLIYSHMNAKQIPILIANIAIFAALGIVISRLFIKIKNDIPNSCTAAYAIRIAVGCFLFIAFYKSILSSFNITHLPLTSWSGATFYNSLRSFYIDRLLEFSLIYFFGFSAFFISPQNAGPEEHLFRLGSIIMILFFTIWGAFQSRYIIAVNPLLTIIGTKLIWTLYQHSKKMRSLPLRLLSHSGVIVIIYIMLSKLMFINSFISYPNDLCYF